MVNVKKTWKLLTSPKAKSKYKKAWENTKVGANKVASHVNRLNYNLDSTLGIDKRKVKRRKR